MLFITIIAHPYNPISVESLHFAAPGLENIPKFCTE